MQSLTCPQLQGGVPGVGRLHSRVRKLPGLLKSSRKASVQIEARYSSSGGGWRLGGTPGPIDRVLAALPYVLPYIDAVVYGRYLFQLYPAAKALIRPFVPLIGLYYSLPFGSFIVFFGLYIGLVNNRQLSRFVRFNAAQAILLDILLALPRLVESVLTPPASGWGAQLYAQSQSFIWVFTAMWVVYGIANSFLGQYARIPFIAEAADQQVR